MPLPIPTTEKPSTSETAQGGNERPSGSVPAAEVPSEESSMGGVTAGAGVSESKGSAEEAADKLYEERIEEEYAKREGGA